MLKPVWLVAVLVVTIVSGCPVLGLADPPAPSPAEAAIEPIEVRARDNWQAAEDRHRIFQALDLPEDPHAGAHGLTLSPKRGEMAPHPDLEALLGRFTDRHLPADHRIIGMLYLGSFGGPDMGVVTEHDQRHFVILMDDPRRLLPVQIAHLPGRTPRSDLLLLTFITHDRDARNPADAKDRRPNLPRCVVLRRAGVAVITERDLLIPIKAAIDKLPRGAAAPVPHPRLADAGLALTIRRDAGDQITVTLTGARPGVDVHERIGESMRLVDGRSNDIATDDFAAGPDLVGNAGDPPSNPQLQLAFPRTALRGLDDVVVRLRLRQPPTAVEPDAAAPIQPPAEPGR